MAGQLPVGPYRNIEVGPGIQVPWYMIPFDEEGNCTGPLTRDDLLAKIQDNKFTDIFVFSHGWNNNWQDATANYEGFLKGYLGLRQSHNLTYPRPVNSLLVGIFWPSIVLNLPWENGPVIAAGVPDSPEIMDAKVAQEQMAIQSVSSLIDKKDVTRFYKLVQQEQLNEAEALELATILAPLYNEKNTVHEEIPPRGPTASAAQLVNLWQATTQGPEDTSGEFGFADVSETGPATAGIFKFLDPREIVRAATVLQMKDRAGTVGAFGVGLLLTDLLSNNKQARFHLIGHSYGCKVLLSALCYRPLPRKVNSVLLLQPAISYLCFAQDATGTGMPGGYRVGLERVEQPILATFSTKDVALTELFHLAVRRPSDIGELQIAGAPASRYAALGGFGPGGCDADCKEIAMKRVGEVYDLAAGPTKIYGLNSTETIHGHGDISNEYTWWTLFNQVAQ